MNVYIETFGCTFNQADSQIMAGLLHENGVKLVNNPQEADAIIINTCYVKHPTEQKVINRIQSLQVKFPDKKLLITGCMVEIDPDKIRKTAPNAGWISPHQITSTVQAVKSILKGENVKLTGSNNSIKTGLPKIRSNPFIHIIQICEGCNGVCSYCCTRFARGKLQSYPSELIYSEAIESINDGCAEIQLTAQDTAAYGKETGESLSSLINKITNVEGDFRVRIGMMHPKSMMNDADNIINSFMNQKVYKSIHIPIQSGNDNVLADMNRGHTVEDFKEIITKFRQSIPDISIATDVIVGYPTENNEAFNDTLKLISELKPDFLHISKYHHRPGTLASQLDEIEHKNMKERSKKLNNLKIEIALQNNKKMMNTIQKVLITGKGSKGGYIGRTNTYKTIVIEDAPLGSFVNVKIFDAKSTYLKGKII
ncbi:MAG: tRNA (N(6)-L-threonylcarbamoyladenosine(37)-C(2))-methylthiotransferase [Methanobacterium sp.]|jgi:MiaB-like tRNA modifying enzyme